MRHQFGKPLHDGHETQKHPVPRPRLGRLAPVADLYVASLHHATLSDIALDARSQRGSQRAGGLGMPLVVALHTVRWP